MKTKHWLGGAAILALTAFGQPPMASAQTNPGCPPDQTGSATSMNTHCGEGSLPNSQGTVTSGVNGGVNGNASAGAKTGIRTDGGAAATGGAGVGAAAGARAGGGGGMGAGAAGGGK